MLAVYKLRIDTEKTSLSDPAIGFQNGILSLSTAPLTGYCDCLDGNSFSDISQENMIVKGGEMSQIGDVKIKIVSKDIIHCVTQNDIELLGCKAAISAEINGVEKSIFEGMLISSYSQTDEVSVDINLRDSAFANVGLMNLKIPQGFGGGSQLESSYGEECLLKLYKRENSSVSISQGAVRNWPAYLSPELEQIVPSADTSPVLTTFDGKPSFAKNFAVYRVMNADTGRLAKISIRRMVTGPEILGTEGESVEVVSGPGKGESYRIVRAEEGRDLEIGSDPCDVITLDRPVKAGDIAGQFDARVKALGIMSSAQRRYPYDQSGVLYQQPTFRILQTFRKDSEYPDETSTENISMFRFVTGSNRCAVPLLSGIRPMPYPMEGIFGPGSTFSRPNIVIIDDYGSRTSARVEIKEIERNEKYSILEFPGVQGTKLSVSEFGKYRPRWVRKGIQFLCGSGKALISENCRIFPADGQEVTEDSKFGSPWQTVAEHNGVAGLSLSAPVLGGLHVALYWRIDDLLFQGKYKIRPMFSFMLNRDYKFSARALLLNDSCGVIQTKNYNLDLDENEFYVEDNHNYRADIAISLTRNEAKYTPSDQDEERALLRKLRNLLVFDSDTEAKYVYLQLFFDVSSQRTTTLKFAALPVECMREVELNNVWLKGYYGAWSPMPAKNIASLTEQLCHDYGVETDNESFGEAAEQIGKNAGDSQALRSEEDLEDVIAYIPFGHGEKLADKIAEICRAANFSVYSNGSKLHAKYFFSGESEWLVTPADIMKGSVEVRALGLDSVATEWDFEANVWGVQKTLSTETAASFPENIEWVPSGSAFSAELIYKGYRNNKPYPGFGARIDSANSKKLYLGGIYGARILSLPTARCELVSVRANETGADALFTFILPISKRLRASIAQAGEIEITPLKQEFNWRETVSGTLDIDIASAKTLHEISWDAFKKTKRRIKLDERYSKHKIAAFGADGFWLQNFISTAAHNSYAKTIVSFKTPIDRLPEGSLSGLLLKRVTLAFGRFRNNHLEGWIVGYSLSPAENAARIEVMNSEPVKEILWLDENMLDDQLTVDERESTQEFYSEA